MCKSLLVAPEFVPRQQHEQVYHMTLISVCIRVPFFLFFKQNNNFISTEDEGPDYCYKPPLFLKFLLVHRSCRDNSCSDILCRKYVKLESTSNKIEILFKMN